MDWVHYLNDPATTEWGKLRASNGHSEPYNVKYIQIDNEPMNHGLTLDKYAEIVNLYGRITCCRKSLDVRKTES